ncbi:sentrin-specific protease 2-like [Bemisia tabaci]|uniref:sentrin-specific protease 2-like n=1 Tax=Bemisia tabaci TaxID=7038 RepID=UPI003B2897C5
MDISRDALAALLGGEYISDEVINSFFDLLQERSSTSRALPRIKILDSFLFQSFQNRGPAALVWRQKNLDFKNLDFILVPYHASKHWSLVVADLRTPALMYLDSKHFSPASCLAKFKTILQHLLPDEDISRWPSWPVAVPLQQNEVDCGPFTCVFAEAVSRRASIVFSQNLAISTNLRVVLKDILLTGRAVPMSSGEFSQAPLHVLYPPLQPQPVAPQSSCPAVADNPNCTVQIAPATLASMREYVERNLNRRRVLPFAFYPLNCSKRVRLYPREAAEILRSARR